MAHCTTDHSRARAWIRLAVNEQSLESYVSVGTAICTCLLAETPGFFSVHLLPNPATRRGCVGPQCRLETICRINAARQVV